VYELFTEIRNIGRRASGDPIVDVLGEGSSGVENLKKLLACRGELS
jgi:hypothetical protein